jgi:transposase-like protein/DDE family transposase
MRKSKSSGRKQAGIVVGTEWVEGEVEGSEFTDQRLKKRFGRLLEQIASGPGESIPLVCEDWANTKAAYRFLSNDQVSEAEILAGHFQSTRERFAATEGPVLVLHDTTEFSYKREDIEAVGKTRINIAGAYDDGRLRLYTACGILMHSSLAVTTEGLPLGLSAIKFWTREKFKGASELKRHINPTRVPIEQKESIRWLENLRQATELLEEPARCVHIGDRESDIYELFCAAQDLGTRFLLRTCVDRLAGDGEHTIADEMAEVDCKGLHRVHVQDKKGNLSVAVLELRYRRIRVQPPLYKQKKYPPLVLTVLHARERDKPRGRERVDWKLLTNLPVTSRADAIEKLQWYALRWKIETFHKILKSGCKAEESKLRTAERLANLIAIFCIVSWRIFWLTIVNRTQPQAPPTLAFTKLEIQLLDRLTKTPPHLAAVSSVACYLTRLARLGGYLARAHDPPPGNKVIWKGMARLTDIQIGYLLAKDVGN